MIKEIRQLEKKEADYVRYLIRFGHIKPYFTADKHKYLCFNTEEVGEYRKNVRMGRPFKGKTIKESKYE